MRTCLIWEKEKTEPLEIEYENLYQAVHKWAQREFGEKRHVIVSIDGVETKMVAYLELNFAYEESEQ